MKRLILLAVCAAALFAAVPSSAACLNSGSSYACAEPYAGYEFCAWGYSEFGAVLSDNCVDATGDEYYDFYVYGYGPAYFYDVYRADLNVGANTKAGPRCTYVWAQPNPGDPAGVSTYAC